MQVAKARRKVRGPSKCFSTIALGIAESEGEGGEAALPEMSGERGRIK